jgi:RNA polymerase sigma factor (sigma-70 family)
MAELQRGKSEAAWDLFVDRYRRLIVAAIRHYAQDYDDVMDVFARVCEALREDDFRRLRQYVAEPEHRARFSTWLVTVVRHLTVDWFRHRDGRRRVASIAEELPPLHRRIFELVFIHHRSHVEAYELIRGAEGLDLSFREFLAEVAATYRAVTARRRGQLARELGGAPPVEPLDAAEPAAEPPAASDAREAIAAVMESLAPEERVAVELYVIDELPARDVARILGLPNSKAVYNRVYRALAALRERLERAGILRGDL